MCSRYQNGYLRCVQRKNGSWAWEFLWRENGPLGKKRRTVKVGSLDQFPTRELATKAVRGLKMCINAETHRRRHRPIQMLDLIDRFIQTELSPNTYWYSPATRIIYREFLELTPRKQRQGV